MIFGKKQGGNWMGRGLWKKQMGRGRLLLPKTLAALQEGLLSESVRLCRVSSWLICSVPPTFPFPAYFQVRWPTETLYTRLEASTLPLHLAARAHYHSSAHTCWCRIVADLQLPHRSLASQKNKKQNKQTKKNPGSGGSLAL